MQIKPQPYTISADGDPGRCTPSIGQPTSETMTSPDDAAAMSDLDGQALADLERKVLDDPQLARLAGQWMLGTSRSLEDFITYNRYLIEAARCAPAWHPGATGTKG